MLRDDLVREGQHAMTVCNACRYCEAYCPVFQAIEERLTFSPGDLAYLGNLCHNCGECLYACQYAPPHEFAMNVPRTLSTIRVASYEACCWPSFVASAFRRQRLTMMLGLVLSAIVVLGAAVVAWRPDIVTRSDWRGDFYSVMPHSAMVALFMAAGLFAVGALAVACGRFVRETGFTTAGSSRPAADGSRARFGFPALSALRDALTLRHLHGTGADCTDSLETRRPWRRWFHHCTMYGFMLCFASTSVAAIYHLVFGWPAPYGYTSLPVMLGTAGGMGLLIGPAGLFALRRTRDKDLTDPAQSSLDIGFLLMLFLTSLTGLLLLVFRNGPAMPALLVAHLGVVFALFVMLPYGKFVHGIYRTVALVKFAFEKSD